MNYALVPIGLLLCGLWISPTFLTQTAKESSLSPKYLTSIHHPSMDTTAATADSLSRNAFYRVVFYNVENLFDTENDSLTLDDDFTPEGELRWTYNRYLEKVNKLFKTLTAIGGWEAPELVGMCEIENSRVLKKLLYDTPLRKQEYRFVHYDSPDERGIDVALIYRKNILTLLHSEPMRMDIPDAQLGIDKTRDVLYASFRTERKDTLHVFVCHFPSRRSGQAESEYKRVFVAEKIRAKIDSIQSQNSSAKILVMGDFNDYPDSRSLYEVLMAKRSEEITQTHEFCNLTFDLERRTPLGSHKFQGRWGFLDNMLVSRGLLQPPYNGLYAKFDGMQLFSEGFLLQEDDRNDDYKTYPTYAGPSYKGGFSDHLPVYLDLYKE